MHSSIVSDVIIYSGRVEVTKVATDHLKMKGVSNLVVPDSAEDCMEALRRFPKALLIIDWELGAEPVVKVLALNRQRFAITGRPVLLIAPSVSENLVATAAEYAVAQIFTEALTAKNLGARLAGMILAEGLLDEVRKTLSDVGNLRQGGDHKGALQLMQKALAKHPTNLRLKSEAGETLLAMGETEKALQLLEGMDKAKPPYLRGMHLYGRACLRLGRYPEALKAFEQANLFNPHDTERLVDVGQALLNMDRVKDADRKFDEALRLDPDLRAAHVGKGQVKLMEGNVNEALAVLKGVSGELEMAAVFNTCAVLNMRHGRHEGGMSLYQAALRHLGKDPRLQARLYFNMGIGFRRWNKKDKAIQCIEVALKLDPAFAKAQQQLTALQAPAGSGEAESKAKPMVSDTKPATLSPLGSLGNEPGGSLLDFDSDLSSLLGDDLDEDLFGKGA